MLCAHSKVGTKNSLANSILAICGLTAFLLFIFISFSLLYVAAIFSFISELFTSWIRILISPVSMWIREDSDYVNPWWSRSETLSLWNRHQIVVSFQIYKLKWALKSLFWKELPVAFLRLCCCFFIPTVLSGVISSPDSWFLPIQFRNSDLSMFVNSIVIERQVNFSYSKKYAQHFCFAIFHNFNIFTL